MKCSSVVPNSAKYVVVLCPRSERILSFYWNGVVLSRKKHNHYPEYERIVERTQRVYTERGWGSDFRGLKFFLPSRSYQCCLFLSTSNLNLADVGCYGSHTVCVHVYEEISRFTITSIYSVFVLELSTNDSGKLRALDAEAIVYCQHISMCVCVSLD